MANTRVARVGCIFVVALAASCGGDDAPAGSDSDSTETLFVGDSELFPSLDFSTGLVPPGSPVQASFSVSAKGSGTVRAATTASGSGDSATLTGLPGRGELVIEGGFALVGQLVVDLSGLSYDGPIPGLENIDIPVTGSAAFDPFAIDHPVSARADIPPSKLPPIPLQSVGVPGQLVLEIAEGSFAELAYQGICAGIDGSTASYSGQIHRSGTLVIQPSIEIELPVVGTKKSFDIPKFSVDLALGSSPVDMTTEIEAFAKSAPKGDRVTGSCQATEAGGPGGGGVGGSTSSTDPSGGSGSSGEPPTGCAAEPDPDSCANCCYETEPEAAELLDYYWLSTCTCTSGSPCAGLCPGLCDGSGTYDGGCDSCLDAQVACFQEAAGYCADNPTCAPIVNCFGSCLAQ
jgi:hypothetical protein